MSINVGVIGVGNIGYHHTRIYSELQGVKLIGVVDKNRARAETVADEFKIKSFPTINDLLVEVDAVSLCVSTEHHHSISDVILSEKKHLLIEKPITTDYLSAKQIVNKAESENVILHVGHVERFNPVFKQLKKIISDGLLGDVIHIVARRVGGFPPKITSTGVFYDLAVHDVDLIIDLLESEPEKMIVQKYHTFSNQVEDSCSVLLSFKNSSAFIQTNWITPVKIRSYSVTGTKGYAEVNLISQTIDLYEHNANKEDFIEKQFDEFLKKYGDLKSRRIVVERSEPLMNEIKHFINVIAGKEKSVMNHKDILRLMYWMGKKSP